MGKRRHKIKKHYKTIKETMKMTKKILHEEDMKKRTERLMRWDRGYSVYFHPNYREQRTENHFWILWYNNIYLYKYIYIVILNIYLWVIYMQKAKKGLTLWKCTLVSYTNHKYTFFTHFLRTPYSVLLPISSLFPST